MALSGIREETKENIENHISSWRWRSFGENKAAKWRPRCGASRRKSRRQTLAALKAASGIKMAK